MAVSEARKRATYKYIAKSYDRIVLNLPRGERDRIKKAAEEAGESVNAYIKRAISAQMQRKTKERKRSRVARFLTERFYRYIRNSMHS